MFKAAVVLTVALSCWALFASEKAIEQTEASRIAELSVQLDKHDFDEVAKQIRRAPRLALSRDVLGEGLLHKAAKNGHRPTAELLLEYGASTEVTNIRKLSAFHVAAINDQLSILELFITRGADINSWGEVPQYDLTDSIRHIPASTGSPLDRAAQVGSADAVAFLLSLGAKIESGPKEVRFSSLHHAMSGLWRARRVMIQQQLHDRRLFDLPDPGEPPELGNRVVIDLLIEHGADPRAPDFTGREPIHVLADAVDAVGMAHLLGKYKDRIDVNALDRNGMTPLWYASNSQVPVLNPRLREEQVELIELLKRHGAH